MLALAVLPIEGCGGPAATFTPSPATTQQASFTPAPTVRPSPDLAALASEYTTIAVKATTARTQCAIDVDAAAANLTSARAAAQQCLDDFRGVVTDFKAISWGPVQPQADGVVAAINALDTLAAQMASAATAAAFRAAYDELPSAEVAFLSAANKLRTALGLPIT
jgi:hypothetical protein